jgi:hypothetical protein
VVVVEQGEQERVGEGGQEQEFLASLPTPDTQALQRQLALAIAPTEFDLPAARVGIDDAPGILGGGYRFGGEQIPGFLALALPRDD